MNVREDSLQSLQRWMLDTLIAPDGADVDTIAATLLPGPKLSPSACLAIYQRSYILRLRKCLEEQFPASYHALGMTLFDDFADEYLRVCPSDSYTLHELGRRFPEWLEDNRPDRGEPPEGRESWIDFMVDLAGYERDLYRLFDAQGHEGQPWPDIAADDGTLILQPCLALVEYRYPVAWYYHEVRAGRSPQFPVATPSYVVILRRDFLTHTYPVTRLHYRFLSLVAQTRHVPASLEALAAEAGYSVDDVQRSWREEVRRPWLDAGFFVERAMIGR
ncbi:HvfC/BufC family peptide modification chaperone [Paraburkholderia sp.]|uniref:HvfC/BufC family peptide modification chaperone n=1 Tax=Paraburkholderia sp. TaxID=1926495 RepID=UPI003D6E6C9E